MKTKIMNSLFTLIFLLFLGCAPGDSGTSGGNPLVEANVSVQSTPYTNDGTVVLFYNSKVKKIANLFLIPSAMAAPVSEFKFCITKLKVVSSENGTPGASVEAILGLIQLDDSSQTYNWGNITLIEGQSVSEIHFEVHHDPENCSGADYSALYNGQSIQQDLEFKFKFSPAITVSNGDTISLGISTIAKAMEDAHAAGEFNNSQITTYLESAQIGTGEKL